MSSASGDLIGLATVLHIIVRNTTASSLNKDPRTLHRFDKLSLEGDERFKPFWFKGFGLLQD